MATRGFSGKGRPAAVGARLPPGQFVTDDFPVLSAGPTPHTPLSEWSFSLDRGGKKRKGVSLSQEADSGGEGETGETIAASDVHLLVHSGRASFQEHERDRH